MLSRVKIFDHPGQYLSIECHFEWNDGSLNPKGDPPFEGQIVYN